MSETSYSIENAKSGRSSCKKCKEKIGKGEIRIGVASPGPGDFMMNSWYHPKCFNLPRKLASDGITVELFVQDMLQDNTDDRILSNDDDGTSDIIEAIESKQVSASGKKKKSDEEDSEVVGGSKKKIEQIKTNLEQLQQENLNEDAESEEEQPKRKKTKKEVKKESGGNKPKELTDTDRAEAEIYSTYAKYKVDDLKDILRWNRQQVSGTKDELLVRIIDGQMHGRLGFCPSCSKGRMKLEDGGETAMCNGYYDEDIGRRVPCFYKCPIKEAPRFHPWFTSKPSEEEEKELDALEELRDSGKAPAGEDKSASPSSIPPKLAKRASEMPWDLSSTAGVKKAASSMLELCTSSDADKGRIDLPEDKSKARMEIGKLITMNRSRSATEILILLVDKFGFKAVKEKAAKRKRDAISSVCKHPSNVDVMEAILELGDLYFKEGNSNAGITYKKVAEAIKGLDYEITEKNAKGLGKGKTKVEGIGKGSADKIYEFVTTGTMEKLEEKRASA